MRKILLATAAGFAAMVADGATPARAQSAAEVSGQTPQPGLTGYVQGRFRFYGAVVGQDGKSKNEDANFRATNADGSNADGTDNSRGKLSGFDFFDYARVWIGADGVAANGLRYGARLEIRMPGDGARGDGRGTLFYRRAVGYIGTPTLGSLRFGSGTVRAVEQMYAGHILGGIASGLHDGDWNVVYLGQGGLISNSFFYSASGGNNQSAIGYYTPQFFGFDLGISYAPNDGNLNGVCTGSANSALVGCDRLSSSSVSSQTERLRNQIDVMLRYRGTFGPVGLTASGGFRTAEPVDAVANGAGTLPTEYKRATAGIVGAELTWAGLTFGGITTFGPYNRGFTPLPKGGQGLPNRSAFSWQLGARYTIGAITVGAAYHELRTEGLTSTRNAATGFQDAAGNNNGKLRERGFGIGGSYALAPGLALFAEYLWSSVKENGRDFNRFQAGTQDSFKANVGLLGVSVVW